MIHKLKAVVEAIEDIDVSANDRVHISETPLQLSSKRRFRARWNPNYNHYLLAKPPMGLWYGFGDSWFHFIKTQWEEAYANANYAYIIYPDTSRLLSLKTKQDVIDFTEKFHKNLNKFNDIRPGTEDHWRASVHPDNGIDWRKIIYKYDGIEIPSYDDLNLKWWSNKSPIYWWLERWDVPSGCIWSSRSILSIKDITPLEKE